MFELPAGPRAGRFLHELFENLDFPNAAGEALASTISDRIERYAVALHRFLRQRIPDYDYQRHFGGVYYLFLRGLRPVHGPRYGVWHDKPRQRTIDQLDRLFLGHATSDKADA